MPRTRPIAWIVAAASFGALVASSAVMARRIGARNRALNVQTFTFKPAGLTEFTFAGRPVTLTEETDPRGDRTVIVTYGDQTARLRASIPGHPQLPFFERHRDWMTLLRFAPLTGRSVTQLEADIDAGKVEDRLAIVTRSPRPGADPGGWGDVWRTDWFFDFYEFKPEGGFAHERLQFPSTRAWQPPKEGELHWNTWEYQAALMVMPARVGPKLKFQDSALTAAGWTLPVAAISVFTLLGGVLVALAPPRTKSA